jgi:hypothetical protein
MAVATFPDIPSRKQQRARIALVLALFFGLLSLAAVREMKVECGAVLLTGGGKLLTGGGKPLTAGQHCQLVIGDEVRAALPPWAGSIFK